MIDSNEVESEVRHRGRPRKQAQQIRFGPHVYNTPLGFQYSHPTNHVSIFSSKQFGSVPVPVYIPPKNPVYEHKPSPQASLKREKRNAALKVLQTMKKKKKSYSDESPSASEEEVESSIDEDPYDRLLDYDESQNKFLVKFRNKSYLHCDWVSKDEIRSTRIGAMKVKRYKYVGLDEDYTKVDRILGESFENEQKIVLIKWKKLPYENSTFELYSEAEKCDSFESELVAYRDRKKMKHSRHTPDWRPSRENHLLFKESPAFKNENKLRTYQLEGLNWLLNRWYYKQSCIMADEMGLGKTVQSVVFVNSLFTQFEYTAPALIVAPLSTLVHWEREFKNWTDLRVLTYHGSIQGRDIISKYEFQIKAGNINVRLFDVIITTYEMAMAGMKHLTQFEFGVAIYDEAHRLKNPNSKAATCLRSFNVHHKVLLSGTPIQNNLNELWALFNFIDPSRFNSLNVFLSEYKMEKSEDVEKLQELLKPLMLRRMKEDVETSIPMKEETIIEVELTMIQKRYYRAILEKNIEFLTKGDKSNAPNLINAMMELRKCCIHPYLLKGAEEKIIADYFKRKGRADDFKKNSLVIGANENETFEVDNTEEEEECENKKKVDVLNKIQGPIKIGDFVFNDPDEYYKILIQSSGKLVLLDKLLNKLKGQHKVLIFSQMTKCLDLLSEYLNYRAYKHERIDGGVRGDMRQAAIDRFSTGDAFVFLLCTRAGGVGINLTAADTVVIFDSDWNPQNDLQAQARCHRIGQKNEVKIYRLITRNSYEREMFDKAGLKLGLDRAILQKMSFNEGKPAPVGTDSVIEPSIKKEDAIQLLLRKGAYGVLMDTDDASNRFCEEDIDQILERRTKIIKHSDGGNVFSKATFQVEEELEDPHFWENLISQKKSEENEGRIKRQCRRLSREGNLTDELKAKISLLYDKHVTSEENANINQKDVELELFQMFLKTLRGSVFDLEIDIYNETANTSESFQKLSTLVKYCLDLITPAKLKNDFLAYMESFDVNYDPNNFLRYSDYYLEYHEPFLFKIQISMIIHSLKDSEDLSVEKARGWSSEDDKNIISLLLTKGYDNFAIRDKARDEVNQRARKILSVLYHKKEIRDNDNMYFKTILNFGRITERNEFNIENFLKKDTGKLRDLIERIMSMSRRSRRDTAESDCYERIVFFDKLEALEEIPNVRKIGMPKKWDINKDKELKEHLLTEGFIGVYERFNLTEDMVIKRIEALLKISASSKE